MKAKLFVSAAACALLALAGAAAAQQAVLTTADLQLRSGPGQDYPVVGFLPLDSEAWVQGCMDDAPWCLVSAGDMEGWAVSDFLVDDSMNLDVPVVIYEGPVGGPFEPAPEARTYVMEHPVDPIYLEGEVVVGERLPGTVEFVEIPDYEYRYVYVNDRAVLVDPQTGRIVHIVR